MRSQSSLARAAARDAPDLGLHAELAQQLERVAQPVGDALEHRAPERAAVVAKREAGEGAACVRVGVRRALARRGTARTGAPRRPAASAPPRRRAPRRSAPSACRSQAAEPAALSITPIACQVPGTAWQKTCTRASASGAYAGSTAKTTPEVPSTTDTGPGRRDPDPERGGRLVARARDRGRLVRGRQPLERNLERVADLVRPAPAGDVEEQRAGCVGGVDRVLAGQAKPHVVLRQQHVADPRVRLRLVRAQPEQLRGGEAGERAVAGQRDQPVEPDARLDLGALGGRALVVPEDRRAQHALVGVEHDEPVHLPGEADRALRQAREARLRGAPPVLRVLLRPAGLRRRERVALVGGGEHLAVRRDRDRLDAGRADVEPDQCLSPAQAPSAAYTSS